MPNDKPKTLDDCLALLLAELGASYEADDSADEHAARLKRVLEAAASVGARGAL